MHTVRLKRKVRETDKLDLIKIKILAPEKPREKQKIVANHTSNKELVPRIHKGPSNSTANRTQTVQLQSGQKTLKDT